MLLTRDYAQLCVELVVDEFISSSINHAKAGCQPDVRLVYSTSLCDIDAHYVVAILPGAKYGLRHCLLSVYFPYILLFWFVFLAHHSVLAVCTEESKHCYHQHFKSQSALRLQI